MENLQKTALIIIDVQVGFDDMEWWGGLRNNPQAEQNCRKILDLWRENHLPLFHIQHCSTNPASKLAEGHPGNSIKEIVKPKDGETVIKKSVNSAFIGTDLKGLLDAAGIASVVITGLTTDHCVSTTTRMAANYGYRTFVISDATATFPKKGINGEHYDAEITHLTALAQLNGEFATVISTDQLLALVNNRRIGIRAGDLTK